MPPLPREHVGGATRAGGRFVRNSPALIAIMIRAAAFSFFAAGVWALLPLVARHTLGLGSGGYGLLLGCVGIGALLGATFSPSLRRALSPRALVAVCAAAVAGAAVVLAVSHSAVIDGVVLVLTGTGWIIALGLFSASFQSILPAWVKARAMAYYLLAFQGALGIGSLALGGIAQATSLDTSLIVLAGGVAVSTAATWPLALPRPGDIDVTPAEAMPLPDLEPTQGPVLVVVTYSLAPGSEDEFLAQRDKLRHFRGRTGAFDWRLFIDGASPTRYVETYLVGSWEEHERQHARATEHDQQLLAHIDTLLAPGTHREASHYLAVPAHG